MAKHSGLTDPDIARWRLRSQHLTRPYAETARDVVGHLLAVQAENPQQSAWAVACRTETADPTDLGGLLDSGAVLRTHVLRPTWHYVRAEDIVWLIEVTAPRVLNVTAQQLTDLDDRALDRASAAVLDSLATEGDLTRTQLAEALAVRGVAADSHMLKILLAHLELQTLIGRGRPATRQHAYELLSTLET